MARVVISPPEVPASADGSRVGGWWHETDDGRVVCDLCPRGCSLRPSNRGFCFVRANHDGPMVSTTYGRSTGFCIDPIEKKPLNQFYPGTAVLSFGTPGCNLGCKFCQNWHSSKSRDVQASCEHADPETIAEAARRLDCRGVAFTYNDPVVWAEYAIDTARACRQRGIKTVAVTAGYIMPAAREAFFEVIDAANVDLKGFTEEFYREMTDGHLQPVLDTLRWIARESRTWLELTNLVIPQANDSPDDLKRMCEWIAKELGPEVPLHFSAFHPDFKLTDRGATQPETLLAAYEIARQAGLRYVYTGNIVDPEHQHTYCPQCGQAVIERFGYEIVRYAIQDGRCKACGTSIAGHYDDTPGNWGSRRQPIRIAKYADRSRTATDSTAKTPALAGDEAAAATKPQLAPSEQQLVLSAAAKKVASSIRRERCQPFRELLGETADLPVYGAFVTLKRSGQLRACCGFLGRSVTLGRALEQAAHRSATDDGRFAPIMAGEIEQLDMDVWVLWSPELILAKGADRAKAVEIGRHGVEIAREHARGLLLPGVATEHNLDAVEFLKHVSLKAGLPPDAWLRDDVKLWTFEGYAIHGRLAAALPGAHDVTSAGGEEAAAQDAATPESRPPAVAGTFYPAPPARIRQMLEKLFAEVPEGSPEPWPAAMVPHAGWAYSGRVAAKTLARVKFPSQAIVLCPRHRPGGAAWAVAPHGHWRMPGFEVASDPELAVRLAGGIDGLVLDEKPHREEHAIEVQLPLIARLAPGTRVVGITLGGRPELERLQRFGRQMADVLCGLAERPLLIVSSDMNHFADDAQTRRLDRMALDALETLDPERLYETVTGHNITMCGISAAVVVLETLRHLDLLHRCELVEYATSAEATGDDRRVVGYAGVLLG